MMAKGGKREIDRETPAVVGERPFLPWDWGGRVKRSLKGDKKRDNDDNDADSDEREHETSTKNVKNELVSSDEESDDEERGKRKTTLCSLNTNAICKCG